MHNYTAPHQKKTVTLNTAALNCRL